MADQESPPSPPAPSLSPEEKERASSAAVERACKVLDTESDRVARVIEARRKSGRFLPPFPRKRLVSSP